MAKLPKCGWFKPCQLCEMITSRVTIAKHRRRTRRVSICLSCRSQFVLLLLEEFHVVIISEESVAEQVLLVC
ncbi:hypothetical protein N9A45_01125 [bacterium]|nr:hypothetical protein [bacterium]